MFLWIELDRIVQALLFILLVQGICQAWLAKGILQPDWTIVKVDTGNWKHQANVFITAVEGHSGERGLGHHPQAEPSHWHHKWLDAVDGNGVLKRMGTQFHSQSNNRKNEPPPISIGDYIKGWGYEKVSRWFSTDISGLQSWAVGRVSSSPAHSPHQTWKWSI